MTRTHSPHHLAGAAIAAALAIPSTAALAQPAQAPSIPAPAIAPASPAPPLLAVTSGPVSAPLTATPPTPPAPILVLQDAPAQTAQTASSLARVGPVQRAVRPQIVQTSARPVAPAPAAATSPAMPMQDLAVPMPAVEPAAAAGVPDRGEAEGLTALELGLMGGAIAIGGIAILAAFAGRRRPDPAASAADDVPAATRPPIASAAMIPAASPPPRTADAPSRAPLAFTAATPLAQAVGRHEALVDLGPTPDNPFLTRAKRLRRARHLDQQEAKAAQQDARRRAGEEVMRSRASSPRAAGAATDAGGLRRTGMGPPGR